MLIATIAATTASLGGVVLFRGQPGGPGDVEVYDLASGQAVAAPPALSGITLLSLDFNGRTHLDSLQPDRPRLRADVPGAKRIGLPAGFGSLYRFSRPELAGGVTFGLFVVDAGGDARVALELPGVGPALDQSPFQPRIALAPAGDRALVATTTLAGGDLYELDLATGASLLRTAALPPQRFKPAGLHLTATWGIAATNDSVLRFDRASSGDAQALTFAGTAPEWFSGEVATSSNGAHAVTVAGDAEDLAHVFAFDLMGDAVQVTTQPAAISGAGFLPEAPHGPFLAISDDGTRVAWRTEGLAREAFLGEVPQATPQPEVQLTADALYIDTLDEIGQFYFRPGAQDVVIAVGEAAAGPAGIENLDFYTASLQAGAGASILNLSQTNGIAQPPFVVPSSLKPTATMRAPGSAEVLMFSERSGGSGDLVAVGPSQTGVRVVVPDVKELDFVEWSGGFAFAALQRSGGPKDRELWRVPPGLTPPTAALMSTQGLNTLERTAAAPSGAFALVETTAIADYIWRFDPASSQILRFSGRPLRFGPTLDFAPSGELVFSVGAGGVQSLFAAWPFGAPVMRLPVPVSPGFVLPGV